MGGLLAVSPAWFFVPVCLIALIGGMSTGTTTTGRPAARSAQMCRAAGLPVEPLEARRLMALDEAQVVLALIVDDRVDRVDG